MDTFEIIAGIASILSLVISLFVAKKVYNISEKIEIAIANHDGDLVSQKLSGFSSNVQVGRDMKIKK